MSESMLKRSIMAKPKVKRKIRSEKLNYASGVQVMRRIANILIVVSILTCATLNAEE